MSVADPLQQPRQTLKHHFGMLCGIFAEDLHQWILYVGIVTSAAGPQTSVLPGGDASSQGLVLAPSNAGAVQVAHLTKNSQQGLQLTSRIRTQWT